MPEIIPHGDPRQLNESRVEKRAKAKRKQAAKAIRRMPWRKAYDIIDYAKDEIDVALAAFMHHRQREEAAADLVEYINLHYRGGIS